MKAVIVEINGKYAVALDKEGRFIKIRNNGKLDIGFEVEVPSRTGFNRYNLMKTASIAAAFLMTLGLSYVTYTYCTPYSYIDVDINPSIEVTANRYDRIIKIEGLNNDGTNLLSEGSYTNKKLEDGIGKIVENAVKAGYLKQGSENTVMLTVSGKNENEMDRIESKVEDTAAKELDKSGIKADVLTDKVTLQKREEAESLGVSPGKMQLIDKARAIKPELKIEDLKDESVKAIVGIIKEGSSNQGKNTVKDNQENTNGGGADSAGISRMKDDKGNNGNNNHKNGNAEGQKAGTYNRDEGKGKYNNSGNGKGDIANSHDSNMKQFQEDSYIKENSDQWKNGNGGNKGHGSDKTAPAEGQNRGQSKKSPKK